MKKKLHRVVLLMALVATALALPACGEEGEDQGGGSTSAPSAGATGEPIKIAFDEGFTGFMATDTMLVDHGIQVALAQIDNQVLGRPIEYIKADNGSDPVQAVDKARQLVESEKIAAMLGPMFSPANAAVTDYLGKHGGIPSISFMGQPMDNMKTANKLSFIPTGFWDMSGYYLGKYAGELGYKTANAICFEDTPAHAMVKGFTMGFAESGGEVLSSEYLPYDTLDFAPYLTSMKKADCTAYWIFGNASSPFISQYKEYGLTAPLLALQASCLTEEQIQDLGDAVVGVRGVEYYVNTLENPLNEQFVKDYVEMWDGEYPNLNAWGGWFAVNLLVEGLKKTNGDTTPAALIEAMSTASFDTPAGPIVMEPYQDAFIGTTNLYICEVQKGADRYEWVALKTYEGVKNVAVEDL